VSVVTRVVEVHHNDTPYLCCVDLIQTTHAQHYADKQTPYVSDDPDCTYRVVGRDKALETSHAWRRVADEGLFFMDFGESAGMTAARHVFVNNGIPMKDMRLADSAHWRDRMIACGCLVDSKDDDGVGAM
jgi:hypothetical protein